MATSGMILFSRCVIAAARIAPAERMREIMGMYVTVIPQYDCADALSPRTRHMRRLQRNVAYR